MLTASTGISVIYASAEEAMKKAHGDEESEERVSPDELQTFQNIMGGPAPCSPGHPRHPEAIHHDGHGEKPQTGDEEGHRGPGPGNDEASQRRCDDACPLPNGGVQRHGAEHDPAIDQMWIEGLTGWLVEGFNRSCAKSDDQDVPHLDNIEEGESRRARR